MLAKRGDNNIRGLTQIRGEESRTRNNRKYQKKIVFRKEKRFQIEPRKNSKRNNTKNCQRQWRRRQDKQEPEQYRRTKDKLWEGFVKEGYILDSQHLLQLLCNRLDEHVILQAWTFLIKTAYMVLQCRAVEKKVIINQHLGLGIDNNLVICYMSQKV